jgi:chorismate synthase
MASNTFGELFRVSTFGESHGAAIGVVIDGCPAGLPLRREDIQKELNKRRPGQSSIVSDRNEQDQVEILSGIFDGHTLGTPIALLIRNEDHRSADYAHLEKVYRPSHADYTWEQKFGIRDFRGGGRSSARETAARVAAGAIAAQWLRQLGISIQAFVSSVGDIRWDEDWSSVSEAAIESNAVRCPDQEAAAKMEALIATLKAEGDSIGGIITTRVQGCPTGLGEPVFDKLPAVLGHAILSINACKGFEMGSGFAGARMKGSEHNDAFISEEGKIKTRSNHSGGIQGGISNGMDIVFRAAFKPVATILRPQQTVNTMGEPIDLQAAGRHDPCVLPRAVPIVSAMTAITLADFALRSRLSKL